MDIYIEYVDVMTGELLSSIQVANTVLRYRTIRSFMIREGGPAGRNIFFGMREYLTISTYSMYIHFYGTIANTDLLEKKSRNLDIIFLDY